MTPLLQLDGVTKRFGDGCEACLPPRADLDDARCARCGTVTALRDVSLMVAPGEILGVLGESGSGKTTLLSTICGDITPEAGRIILNHEGYRQDLVRLDALARRRLGDAHLAIVRQNPQDALMMRVSAGGNVADRLLAAGEHAFAAVRERAAALLEETGIDAARMDEPPTHFSGGMQRRIQIARAIATRPALILLDEVTNGLDACTQARILDLILELQHGRHTAMIAVSHDLRVLRLLADRAVVMRAGRVVEAGLMDQILEDPQHAYTQELVAAAL